MANIVDESRPLEWSSPAWDGEVVDVSSTDYTVTKASEARGLYVGGAGDVVLLLGGGGSIKFSAVPVGTFMPTIFTKVVKTGTTATLMVALT